MHTRHWSNAYASNVHFNYHTSFDRQIETPTSDMNA